MSDAISTHYVQQYGSTIALLLQQKGSKLRQHVMTGSYKGKAASVVEQFAAVTAQRRNTRLEPVTFNGGDTDRRWVYPNDYDWYDAIDNLDKLRMIIDPQSAYVQQGMYAMGRAMDDEIISAFFGTAKTGENGGTSKAWASYTSTQQVAVTVGGAGSGLNVAKLREAKRILMENEVDLESDPIIAVITAEQHDDLLNEVQVVSTDFNNRPVLVDGKIQQFLGIQFVHCERLGVDGSSYRRVPIYAKSGMHLGIWEDIKGDVTPRPDLRGKPIQVGCMGTFGATRLEEKKIVEVLCAE